MVKRRFKEAKQTQRYTMFMDQMIKHIKMSVLPKLIYMFKVTLVENSRM